MGAFNDWRLGSARQDPLQDIQRQPLKRYFGSFPVHGERGGDKGGQG